MCARRRAPPRPAPATRPRKPVTPRERCTQLARSCFELLVPLEAIRERRPALRLVRLLPDDERERLGVARHLESPDVDRLEPDVLDQFRRDLLCLRVVAAVDDARTRLATPLRVHGEEHLTRHRVERLR